MVKKHMSKKKIKVKTISVDDFGPKNETEERIFAEQKFRVYVQFLIKRTMNRKNISEKELAEKLGTTEFHVNQFFSPKCNIKVLDLAAIFWALGEECILKCVGEED